MEAKKTVFLQPNFKNMFDRNTLIGLGLIGLLFFGWIYMTKPSEAELKQRQKTADSIALVNKKAEEEAKKAALIEKEKQTAKLAAVDSSIKNSTLSPTAIDSLKNLAVNDQYKDFAVSAKANNQTFSIENDKMKVNFTSKGGKVSSVVLKEYKRAEHDSKPGVKEDLELFNTDSLKQSLIFNAYNNLIIDTDSLYFTSTKTDKNSITLKLATSKPESYIEYVYSLKPGDYMLDYKVNFVGLDNIISKNNDQIDLAWKMILPSQEAHISKEREKSTIWWKSTTDSPDNLGLSPNEDKSIAEAPIKWVAFRQQFFTSALIANSEFQKDGSNLTKYTDPTSNKNVCSMSSRLGIPYKHNAKESFDMKFYFGPNHYNTLKQYDLGLEKLVSVGWSIFSVLNTWMVIPVFNAFKDSTWSFGLIILVLTLIIKTLLFPIAYKTYISGAKMRLLKPELDAINAKYENDAMKKNQENMALYKKAGVSPFSGCIPALIQFPILIALFSFFPESIELRQKSFWWAHDLSTYDSVYDFGTKIWGYGDHVSLFALMMFVSTILYTWMNQRMTPMNNTQMPGMKYMMYLMPVIFLSFMNSYSAGLSWYYFLANMITFGQTYLMRFIVSDEKLRGQIDANMKKPVKKGGFAARLEEMQRTRAQQLDKGKKK